MRLPQLDDWRHGQQACERILISLTLGIMVLGGGLPDGQRAWGQPMAGGLQERLYQAIGNQDWPQAIQIVDAMIQANPSQAASLRQYRQQLTQMRQVRPTPTNRPPNPTSIPTGTLGIAMIQRRQNGIPIIRVKFNQRLDFEMMVDSGASMTVITRPMAAALGLTAANVVDEAVFNTANGKVQLPIIYVGMMEVAGLGRSQIPVAVAGADMKIGLLGQDFLQAFDVSIRQNQIEFHSRP